ncbi:succinate-semialdehyde dehydrogenase [Phakopsora pachyrhizi]|uniref:Succinate-semialdehyde dehydrogenase n=1 Tax=Phakopsora pachyrhizi TaxID=170000 RepID=A0AAV0AQ00_PHAPC|nr:succinate-semialdehyde dehydrogenase [Phakopsora pachyrhizi]
MMMMMMMMRRSIERFQRRSFDRSNQQVLRITNNSISHSHLPYSSSTSSDLLPSILEDRDLFRQKAYVNGEWIESNSSKRFSVKNPATGEEIGTCSDLNLSDLSEAIDRAHEAFCNYKNKTPNQISQLLNSFDVLMKSKQKDLTRLIVAENGKSFKDAEAEVIYASSFLNWFSAEALRSYGDIIPSSTIGVKHLVIRQPIGPVAALCPWNFPAAMITRKIAPALAAGCSVIIKAPAETPFTALAIAELSHRAGFPPGVVNVITTESSTFEIGKELCENDLIKKLSFTGSTAVGKILMKQSSSSLKKLSLELGGNAPFIVFDDADIDEAVNGAIACKFRGSGQTCVSANRFFVHSSVYAEFASKLTKKVSELKVGSGFEEGVRVGPLISQKSLDKVIDHVERAKARGAEVLIGGKRFKPSSSTARTKRQANEGDKKSLEGTINGSEGVEADGGRFDGYFYEPTVLSDVPIGAIDQEETFGPVVALYKFETEQEVLKLSNDTGVGLAGYFYSKDLSRIFRVSEKLEVGMVGTNTGIVSNASTPFGGIKHSGFGREGGKYGIQEFQYLKYIALGGL